MLDIRKQKYSYQRHKDGAKKRGIEFLLTFDQWLKIWLDSGNISNRGTRLGQYVMARFGDKGPYAVWNVEIVTSSKNHSSKVFTPEYRQKLSAANTGKVHSEETCRKMSESAKKRRTVGRTLSEETKRKISQTKKLKFLALQQGRKCSGPTASAVNPPLKT